jgi:hypothetical protein
LADLAAPVPVGLPWPVPGRVDIAVHQSGGVRDIQRRGHWGDEPGHASRRQRPLPLQHLLQVTAAYEPHRDEQHAAGPSEAAARHVQLTQALIRDAI